MNHVTSTQKNRFSEGKVFVEEQKTKRDCETHSPHVLSCQRQAKLLTPMIQMRKAVLQMSRRQMGRL